MRNAEAAAPDGAPRPATTAEERPLRMPERDATPGVPAGIPARIAARIPARIPAWAARRPGLRLHLLALVLAALIPALAIGGGAAWHLARSYRFSFETRLQDTTRALALFVDSELETRLTTALALAASPLAGESDLTAFSAWARILVREIGGFVVINEAAPGHRQLLNTALPEGAPLPPPSRPGAGAWDVIQRVVSTGRPAISDLFTGVASGRLGAVAAAPVLRDGQVIRVVVLAIDPAALSTRLRERRPSGSAFVSVADGPGRIVARSQDHDRFFGTVPPSRGVPEAERDRGVFRARTVYGEEALFFAQRLNHAPWTVVVAEPLGQYRRSWLAPLAALILGAASATLLGLAVAAWLARRVLRPVTALVRRAEAVASGDARAALPAVPPSGVAEFEALRQASERAEHALAAREAEFRAIFETAAAGVAELDTRTGLYLRVNRTFCRIAGREEAELVGRLGPADIAHPEDRAAALPTPAEPDQPGTEGRLVRGDGGVVWVQSGTAISARDAAGRPLRAVTVMQNITRRKLAEQARVLLAREVDHRAKNVLAIVQAVLRLTPKDDPAAYNRAVEARITALARAHTLLADARWLGADLRTLAEAELGAFQPGPGTDAQNGPQAELVGPAVTLSPAAAQALSLVLHELATNATKYGALSAPGGRVLLSWHRDEPEGVLRLRWAEEGGPAVAAPPARRGFGSRVIESSVRDQLGGSVRPHWGPDGLVCDIALPLDRAIIPEGAVPVD